MQLAVITMSAKETTERQKNLERWSELEPEQCWLEGDNWGNSAYCAAHLKGQVGILGPWADDFLLGALIEAITARGWRMELSVQSGSRVQLYLGSPPLRSEAFTENGPPADAVLSAYIQALEAI